MKLLPYIITLAAGILIAVLLLHTCNNPFVIPAIIAPKEIVKNVEQKEKQSVVKVDSFLLIEKGLRKIAESLKYSYADLQKQNFLLNIKADSLAQIVPVENEYEQGNKDALIQTIAVLKETEILKDSMCSQQIANVESILKINKIVLVNKDSLYFNLRKSFDTAIDNNYKLIEFSKVQKKEINKRNVGEIVWKVAAIGAGLFIVKTSILK